MPEFIQADCNAPRLVEGQAPLPERRTGPGCAGRSLSRIDGLMRFPAATSRAEVQRASSSGQARGVIDCARGFG